MKIVHISDTHGRHLELAGQLPPADAIVCTGDFSLGGKGMKAFLEWFGNLPYAHRILVRGNHEEKLPFEYNESQILFAENHVFEISGKIFVGLAAFDRWYQSQRGLAAIFERYPEFVGCKVDVVVSHVPPAGILAGERYGSEHLLLEIQKWCPRFHLFGHVHQEYGQTRIGQTVFQNAALTGPIGENPPLKQPLVLEI